MFASSPGDGDTRVDTNRMTPFILLGTARTGSTLVGNALADHPEVLYYGEIFHRQLDRRAAEAARETIGLGVRRDLPLGLPVCRNEDDGQTYLERLFSQGVGWPAVGFKLFYDQARNGPIARVWEYLAASKALKIVHLQRNWLETFVSLKRAWQTGTWHSTRPLELPPIEVDRGECQEYFETLERAQALVQSLLDTHAVLNVEYADLAPDFPAGMRSICKFLGVDPRFEFKAHIARLGTRPLPEDVANYFDLCAHFAATRWSRFFSQRGVH